MKKNLKIVKIKSWQERCMCVHVYICMNMHMCSNMSMWVHVYACVYHDVYV